MKRIKKTVGFGHRLNSFLYRDLTMCRPLIVLFLTISVALYLLSFPYAEALHGQGSSFYRRRRHKVRSYTRFEVGHITVTLDGTAKPYKLVQQKELFANLKIFISIVFQVTFPELTLSCFNLKYVLFLIVYLKEL